MNKDQSLEEEGLGTQPKPSSKHNERDDRSESDELSN